MADADLPPFSTLLFPTWSQPNARQLSHLDTGLAGVSPEETLFCALLQPGSSLDPQRLDWKDPISSSQLAAVVVVVVVLLVQQRSGKRCLA